MGVLVWILQRIGCATQREDDVNKRPESGPCFVLAAQQTRRGSVSLSDGPTHLNTTSDRVDIC